MRELFQRTMAAAAFAEEAEFETARQIASDSAIGKKVIMGTDLPHISLVAIRQALHLCARVGARLEILHVRHAGSVSKTDAEITELAEKMLAKMGIGYSAVSSVGRLDDELRREANSRRDIVCVLMQPMQPYACDMRKRMELLAGKISCPVVVVLPSQ